MNEENFITPIVQELEEAMHISCKRYIRDYKETHYTGPHYRGYSPRWYNLNEFYNESKMLRIQSTQWHDPIKNPHEGFNIQTEFDWIDWDDFWIQFRNWRTNFLETNYPTIKSY
jgi:hypothetical protein|tara:strand:- start:316 stop:657 length:342 start_codon:yes stop_codon:yes gene_type:complete